MTAASITNRQFEIIEAAGKLLTTSGVGGLTIKNLANEMNFSESAIYRHFTSKEEIIIALLQYLAKSMNTRLSNIISKEMTAEEQFKALFESQFTFFKKNPHFVVAVFSDGLMEASQRINETILQVVGVKSEHLLPIIIEGQKNKVFTNTIIANQLLDIVIGTFRLHMYKWRAGNFKTDLNKSGNELIQSLLALIKI